MRCTRAERDARLAALLIIVTSAAARGDPAPSNEVLAARLGFGSVSGPSNYLRVLERRRLIRVERYQRDRVITIVATGARTAEPANKAPHWRDRRAAA